MKIRKAELKDVDRILELFNRSPNLVGGDEDNEYGYKKEHIIDFVENSVNRTFVYELDEKIVGVIQTRFWKVSKYVELNDIIVDKKFQRRGIGFELQNYIEELARKKGYEFIYLNSEEENKSAHAMFEKGGYEKGKKFIFFSKVLK